MKQNSAHHTEPPDIAADDHARLIAPPRRWYGGPIIIADLVAAGFIIHHFSGLNFYDSSTLLCGGAIYLLGGVAIHLWHRQMRNAAKSLGLRVGVPFAALCVAMVIDAASPSGQVAVDLGMLVALGVIALSFVGAVVLDYVYLAWARSELGQ